MKRNKHGFRHVLAVLLNVMLLAASLGVTVFAEEVITTPAVPEESFDEAVPNEDVSASDLEAPVDDKELYSSEPGFKEAVPFEQTYIVRDKKIIVTADAGVFPADGVLYVDSIDDAGIEQSAVEALGISTGDTVLIRHALYSFSGTEMNGTADGTMTPAGYDALCEEYPDAHITFYMMCWDGDYQEAKMLPADFVAEKDQVEFTIPAMTVYDLLTVIQLPEQEEQKQETTETDIEEQPAEGGTEEIVEQPAGGGTEEIVE